MNSEPLGEATRAWVDLGKELPTGCLRLILTDVDGVITRGEGEPADLQVIERLSAINIQAQTDPYVPAIVLCTGRQAPYVELMAQLTGTFLPCIFEHGAGLFFPASFRFVFQPPDHAAQLARLRAAIDEPLIRSGKAFVQPGKEASMTLYPLGSTSVNDLFEAAKELIKDFDVARNVNGVEVRPPGIDKGVGAQRVAAILGISLESMAGVGDSDPDLSYLSRVGFSAAPANATAAVKQGATYVSQKPFGAGLLEIVTLVERRNRNQTLTET